VNSLQPALVVLNPLAHGGRGAGLFDRVRPAIEARFNAKIVVLDSDERWRTDVRAALDRGVRLFISAGGDGTAHALVNALVEAPARPPLGEITLGAVGLGSSNDMHKPVRQMTAGIPVLLDAFRATPRDIIRCRYSAGAAMREAAVVVSASLGVTAEANARFSAATRSAGRLRWTSTSAAIAWAAMRTVATWRNLPARVRIDEHDVSQVALTTLSVLKTEWLSGRLHFGRPIEPASGDFDLAMVEHRNRLQISNDILALLRGRFDGRPGHTRVRARTLDVWLDSTASLEMDGEVFPAIEVHFAMHPERIRLCA
jgi:diacylglycerol kinase family enzyme